MSLGRLITNRSKTISIPAVGLGTWRSGPGEVKEAVRLALEAGYRHVDAAAIYGNEHEVGEGIKASGVSREEIFITSKLWNGSHQPERVEPALRKTLKDLGIDSLDLYLMHWPVSFKFLDGARENGVTAIDWALTLDHHSTWKEMERLVGLGLIKHIGVSNFTAGRITKLLSQCTIKPVVNQIELNLKCAQPELIKFCFDNDIIVESYSPLGSIGASQREDPVVVEIANSHNVDPANILISYQTARGCVCLPKSVTKERIISNFQDVILTKEEVSRLDKQAATYGTQRAVDPSKAWGVDIYTDPSTNQKPKM